MPQSYFGNHRKAKGDLHHLFTCERLTNSTRSNYRYAEVEKVPENRRDNGWVCDKTGIWEPDTGKGEVARATLYFIMRYPGLVGDEEGEYTVEGFRNAQEMVSRRPGQFV